LCHRRIQKALRNSNAPSHHDGSLFTPQLLRVWVFSWRFGMCGMK
jgi:hypothetical protein